MSKDLPKEEMEYALDYCQSKNHYFVAPDEAIPWQDPARLQRQLGYYHWVPITLLLQAFCFYLPSLFWNYACTATGINFAGLLAFAKTIARMTLTDPDRQKHVDTLAAEVDDALLGLHPQRVVGCRLGRRIGSYATSLYLFTKVLYVANVAAQFLLLNASIGAPFAWWGWDVVQALMSGENWQDSPVFPRLTLCDIPIRRLGDSPRYTLQCHLRVNTYNEKFYFVIWWLFALVAVSTACNFAYYALAFLWPWTREDNVRHLVRARQHRDIFYSSKKSDEAVVKFFANVGMQNDGTLLFWFIQ
ncbi:CRE-INX-3 protein, partial [Aphelenchoides avenae]